jgi:hypothetical protein
VSSKQDTNHWVRVDAEYIDGGGGGSDEARAIVHADTASADTNMYMFSVDLDTCAGTWSAYAGDTLQVWLRYAGGLAYSNKFVIPALSDITSPTIENTANFLLAYEGNGDTLTIDVDAGSDEAATWTLACSYTSSYPAYGDETTSHYLWKTATANQSHQGIEAAYVDTVTDLTCIVGPRVYHSDTLLVTLRATDQWGNTSDPETLYSGLVEMPLGEVPAVNHDMYGVACYQSGGLVPYIEGDETPEDYGEYTVWMGAVDHVFGTEAVSNAGWHGWVQQARDVAGSRLGPVLGHTEEYCQSEWVYEASKRKGAWAQSLYDSLLAEDSADTNFLVHHPSGHLTYVWPYEGFGPFVNMTNEFARRRFAQMLVAEYNHSDNRVPYTGLLFDVWEPTLSFACWDTIVTLEGGDITNGTKTGSIYAFDQDLDGTRLGLDLDEQQARRTGMDSLFTCIREAIRATNADSVAEYFLLGGNTDYAYSDTSFLSNIDVVEVEDFGCPAYTNNTAWEEYPWHNAVDPAYYDQDYPNYNLLAGVDYPNPSTFTVTWDSLANYMRTQSGGPWVMSEARPPVGDTIEPELLEVYSLLFDNIHPFYLAYDLESGYRRHRPPSERGKADLDSLGASDGAATLDTTSYSGYWYLTRSYDNGEVKIMLPERTGYDCETDSLEYLVYLTGGDTLRLSDGYLDLDISVPSVTISALDFQYTDDLVRNTTQHLDLDVNEGGTWYYRYRTTTNSASDPAVDCAAWTGPPAWGSWSSWTMRTSGFIDLNTGVQEYNGQYTAIHVQVSGSATGPATDEDCASFKGQK